MPFPHWTPKLRFTLAGCVGLLLHGLMIAAPGAFLLQWQGEFGRVDVGLYYLAFMVSGITGLTLTARRSRRHPLLAGAFLLIGLGLALASQMPSFLGIVLTALLVGLGDSVLTLQSNSLVGELHAERGITFLNLANAPFGIGALTTPLLAAFLSWRLVYLLMALVALLAAWLAWQAPPVANFSPQHDRMPWRRALPFLGVMFLYIGLEGAMGTWSGIYLHAQGWPVVWGNLTLSLYWGGLTIGRLVLATWVNPQPLRRLQWLLLIGALAIGATLIPALGLGFVLAAMVYGPTFAIVFGLLQRGCGHASLPAIFYTAFLAQSLVPTLFSLIPDATMRGYGFVVLAIALYGASRYLAFAIARQDGFID